MSIPPTSSVFAIAQALCVLLSLPPHLHPLTAGKPPCHNGHTYVPQVFAGTDAELTFFVCPTAVRHSDYFWVSPVTRLAVALVGLTWGL